MSAFNVVKFRVKPGAEERFLSAHRDGRANWPGLTRATIIRTAERAYCLIGEWPDLETLAAARASMVATLDSFRDTLDKLEGGLDVTDAVSGPAVLICRTD
jgi:hypothetical protein